jgi:hypothetical protein
MANNLVEMTNEIAESEMKIYEHRYMIVIDTYMEIVSA